MPVAQKRGVSGLAFVAGGESSVELASDAFEESVILSISGALTLTGAGNVRPYASLVREIQIVGPGNKVWQSWKGEDFLKEGVVYEQQPLASQLVPPSSGAVGGPYPFRSRHTVPFKTPFASEGYRTMLPGFLYPKNLFLRVKWGTVDDLVAGGVGTLDNIVVSVVKCGIANVDTSAYGGPEQFAFAQLARAERTYQELSFAAATERLDWELLSTLNTRCILVSAYDAAGAPSDDVVLDLTLRVNDTVSLYEEVPWKDLQGDNARIFGVDMPVGLAIIEAAEDKDLSDLLRLDAYRRAILRFRTSAQGSVRLSYMGISALTA